MSHKDWDSILRNHPDLKDDGSRDELNVVMLRQNAHRLAGLLPSLMPAGLPEESGAPRSAHTVLSREGTSFLRDGLSFKHGTQTKEMAPKEMAPVREEGKPT